MVHRLPFAVTSLAAAILAFSTLADAASPETVECTLIVDAATGEKIHKEGVCDERFSPASTFKVPLAAMGYDAGILTDETTPAWDYKPEYNAVKRDRKTVDPTIWERDSVIWFSRQITRNLGAARFAAYVSQFSYGNADVSGSPGKDDSLTRSWVDSSLEISPVEQVGFLRRLLTGQLPVSAKAHRMSVAILPSFQAGGWAVQGKTGSTGLRKSSGTLQEERALGWFVGWARKGDRRVVFARLVVDTKATDELNGPSVRTAFLKQMPRLLD